MRELFHVAEESTETFYVLKDSEGVRFQLARTELDGAPAQPEAAAPRDAPASPEPEVRPKDIQARIRAGESPAAVAADLGVTEVRIEPYAHPVLLERYQIAEAAKNSHPVRENGPAKLTLFEVLATAFAARGGSLSTAEWDATRQPGDEWVVHVRWASGKSNNEAMWAFKRSMGSAATAEARNTLAADLTDPDFVQPVRSLTAVEPAEEAAAEPADETAAKATEPAATTEIAEGDFLRHPDDGQQPSARRRKAVTPHWEDVLLGVRTNTKRPRG
ncbi:septation protein SepH [Corynebacterium liangguodongii]|uniref:DUF3071 domain-containing protein n=1 Tax=Corynebacterium liangguodongii TaxID=2079535 RepID=A0A2S0WD70_9CORY|nr:septation protein SepH [Corynebacterium liangguodongii]AWB83622.1 DUF3071 domain-containing protein [Corynebacterium liangguodongii]PWB99570.1 DUF3071 domain-containing protein [Corynebacterium liangguodongii]